MVSEHDPPIRRREIASVVETHRRRGARRIERENLAGDEPAVEPVRHSVSTQCRDQQPRGIDRLAARQCQPGKAGGAERRDERPDQDGAEPSHQSMLTYAMKLSMR